ncbi:hypothetical protein MNV84_07488 [Leishmania braziliensis]|nr:hypothetical protein MNV84_07488 [Leishmania braziliensis]
MILLFYITDSAGRKHRLSTLCGPSTTAVGAINQLRFKLSIPTEVDVKLHLTSDVPIRHLTAPLTSLRKQRSGSAKVLRIPLWAALSGPETSINEIDYSTADVEDENDAEAEEDEWKDGSRSVSNASSRRISSPMGSTTNGTLPMHVVFSASPPKMSPVPVQAKRPTAATHSRPNRMPTSSPHERPEKTPDPLAVSEAKRSVFSETTPATTSLAATLSLVIKRRSSLEAAALEAQGPLSSRGPVRCLPNKFALRLQDVPQTTRHAPQHSAVSVLASCTRADSTSRAVGLYKTGYARRDTAVSQIMLREYPKVIPRDPRNIVLAVKDDARLVSCTHNPNFSCSSDFDSLGDATYAQYLSIGHTHGQELHARSLPAGPLLALYGELGTLRHSCCPTAAVHYDLFTAPYAGSCRCALLEGICRGEEITYLYKHADSLAFLLLSRDRRRNILQQKYFMDCDCPRCSETLENTTASAAATSTPTIDTTITVAKVKPKKIATRTKAQLEAELTLTGVFFTDSDVDRDAAKQRGLTQEMHKDFETLQIMDDSGVEINLTPGGNVPPAHRTKQCNRLLGFLRKYGSTESVLRLHEHHWRLNLVRAAYVQETVRLCAVKGATPVARQRDPSSKTLFVPTKTVYDVCLTQLEAEGLFIPPGHPHSLTTYESYLYLLAILPPAIAQATARSAENAPNIKWQQLQKTREVWGVLKRAALPPNIQKILLPKEQQLPPTPPESTPSSAREPLALVEQ